MEEMTSLQYWELASYVVTVFGLPYAVLLFWFEQKRERQNEEEEIYQKLSDEYADFCQLLLSNADLRLMSGEVISDAQMTHEQRERKGIIFEILMALFERAFILVYEENMKKHTQRLWRSWDDYIRFWLKREDFRKILPKLLEGEDPDFISYMQKAAADHEVISIANSKPNIPSRAA